MRIWLSKSSEVPLREQLATQIILGIVSNDLKSGQKLPSTRELARRFDLPVDWSLVHGFAVGVLRATARVPFGHVATYGEMAASAGSPRAARAAGNALHINPIPIVVPCHRIVPASGGLGGYGGGEDRKRFLLDLEGALPA